MKSMETLPCRGYLIYNLLIQTKNIMGENNIDESNVSNVAKKTLGERRVRTEFNPSEKDLVGRIKDATAELINLVDCIPHDPEENGERARLKSLAMTSYEEAAMWAVKAATY